MYLVCKKFNNSSYTIVTFSDFKIEYNDFLTFEISDQLQTQIDNFAESIVLDLSSDKKSVVESEISRDDVVNEFFNNIILYKYGKELTLLAKLNTIENIFTSIYFSFKNVSEKNDTNTFEDLYISILNSNNEDEINYLQQYLITNPYTEFFKYCYSYIDFSRLKLNFTYNYGKTLLDLLLLKFDLSSFNLVEDI